MKRDREAAPTYDEIYPVAPISSRPPLPSNIRRAADDEPCAHTSTSAIASPESSIVPAKDGTHQHCKICEAQQVRLLKLRRHKLCCWLASGVTVIFIIAVMVVVIVVVATGHYDNKS